MRAAVVKLFGAFICALFIATRVSAATADEGDSSKRELPLVSVVGMFGLRVMLPGCERLVAQATSANLQSTSRMLHERPKRDILNARNTRSPSREINSTGSPPVLCPFRRKWEIESRGHLSMSFVVKSSTAWFLSPSAPSVKAVIVDAVAA
jgi:hypothetical protein